MRTLADVRRTLTDVSDVRFLKKRVLLKNMPPFLRLVAADCSRSSLRAAAREACWRRGERRVGCHDDVVGVRQGEQMLRAGRNGSYHRI